VSILFALNLIVKQTNRKQRRALICCEVYFCDAEPFWTL